MKIKGTKTISLGELREYTKSQELIKAFTTCFGKINKQKKTTIIDGNKKFSFDRYQHYIYQYDADHNKRYSLKTETELIQLIKDLPMSDSLKKRYLENAIKQIDTNMEKIAKNNTQKAKCGIKITGISDEKLTEVALTLTRQQYQINETLNKLSKSKTK